MSWIKYNMRMQQIFPQDLIYRSSWRTAIVILFAVLFGHYFSLSEKFWIPITAMWVMQTSIGLAARQGLERFLVITLSVLLVSYLVFYLRDKNIIDVFAVILFAVACYFSSAFKITYPNVAILLMMGLVILISMIFPEKTLHMRTLDVMMGGVIGLIANLFILPVRADVEFRKQTILLLKSCSDYLSAITAYLFDRSIEKDLIDKKIQLEKNWESFPEWVFEAGFAANLQQGHRHFLVRIEQVRQILLMLNHLARYSYEEELLLTLETPMKRYVAQLVQLLEAMSTVLVLQKLSDGVEDISVTFNLLDAAFQKEVPYSIDSLDMNQQNLYLANFIYELGELGSLLIVLTQTLR